MAEYTTDKHPFTPIHTCCPNKQPNPNGTPAVAPLLIPEGHSVPDTHRIIPSSPLTGRYKPKYPGNIMASA